MLKLIYKKVFHSSKDFRLDGSKLEKKYKKNKKKYKKSEARQQKSAGFIFLSISEFARSL